MTKVAYVDGSYIQKTGMYVYAWLEEGGMQWVEGQKANKFTKPPSSHYAEYLAIFSFIPAHMNEDWILRTDSNLVYNQLIGKYKVHASALQNIHNEVKELLEGEPGIKLELIRSRDNLADKAIKESLKD